LPLVHECTGHGSGAFEAAQEARLGVDAGPSCDTSTTRPCSASLGENAIECTAKAPPPERETPSHIQGVVALGRLVLSKRERVIALEPHDKGLLATTLRYPYEVRKTEDYFCDLPDVAISPDMLELAEHILAAKAGAFDPSTFRDRYEEALLAHLRAKQAGAVPERKQTFARLIASST
jgi:hypothetical protein